MNNSSIRDIVKESIREVFYTKPILNEAIFGLNLYVMIDTYNKNDFEIYSMITKSTKLFEQEYRLTWFNRDMSQPRGHVDFDKKDLDYMIETNLPSERVEKCFRNALSLPIESKITLKFADKFDENIQENLLILEEFDRELDVWISGKH